MLNFPTRILIIWPIFFIIQAIQGYCQTGAWIQQAIDLSMSGTWFYGAGETVVMVTRENSRYVYFFDIRSAQWSVVDCQTTQNFKKYAIKGQVAMVYSDSLIVGYSGVTSQWDTVYYRGQPLDPNPSMGVGDPSYGCGENLAWFITDQFVYIFDAELGQWKTHAYNLPFTYTSGNGRFWSREDYAGVIIFDSSLNIFYNLAYSLHHHDFSELSAGGYYDDPTWEYNHGFVAYWWSGGSDYKFIGYSAFTNQFDVLTVNSPYGGLTTPSFLKNNLALKTAFVVHQREFLSSPSWYRLHLYGFDTRHGGWVHHTWEYDEAEWDVGTVESGGQFAIIDVVDSNYIEYYWIYSGLNNSFHWHTAGLDDYGGVIHYYGGSIAAGLDTTKIWFYSANSGASHFVPFSHKDFFGAIMAENFGIISLIDNTNPDNLYLTIYHEPQDLITSLTIPTFSGIAKSTPYILLYPTAGSNKEVFCYSGLVNDYQLIGFLPSSTYVNYWVQNVLGFMQSNDAFALYDGTSNEYYFIPEVIPTANPLGGYIALVQKVSGSNSFYTYSAVIHLWEEKSIPENVSAVLAGKYVGVISTPLAANRFYAYNGFYGNLVSLDPIGNYAAYGPRVGDMTAVIVRHNTVYAFNPQSSTGIDHSESPIAPERVALYQNYPNPFNASSTISYEIPKRDDVKIDLYDIMGRRIKTLYSGQQEPGRYTLKLESFDLSSGIYFYQLRTTEFQETKRCLILK